MHKIAKINFGATIVDSSIGRYTYTCYDDEIVNCEIGHVFNEQKFKGPVK